MAEFKNEKGDILIKDTRKMKLEVGGVLYKRVPKPKYLSRQARLGDYIEALMVKGVEADISELEVLSIEMENWLLKIEGTGLANTGKYKEVVDCIEGLNKGIDFIVGAESLTRKETVYIVGLLRGIYFPLMFS